MIIKHTTKMDELIDNQTSMIVLIVDSHLTTIAPIALVIL